MTVSTTTNRVIYRGNGAATSFAVPFKVLDEDHLVVRRRVFATSLFEHTYVGTDYSYAGLGDPSGTLTLDGAALTDAYELVIERIVPFTQDLDIVNAGGFYPDTVEGQLDLMVMAQQQLDDLTDRALLVPIGKTPPIMLSLTAENGMVLGMVDDILQMVPNDSATAAVLLSEVEVLHGEVEANTSIVQTETASAENAAMDAEADAIEAALSLAAIQALLGAGKIFDTVAAGVAAVAEGDQFFVLDPSGESAALYDKTAGVGVIHDPAFSIYALQGINRLWARKVTLFYGRCITPTQGNGATGDVTQAFADPLPFDVRLKRLRVGWGNSSGVDFKLQFIERVGLDNEALREHLFSITVANGLNTFVDGDDFANVIGNAGELVGFYSGGLDGLRARGNPGENGGGRYSINTYKAVGVTWNDDVPVYASRVELSLEFEGYEVIGPIDELRLAYATVPNGSTKLQMRVASSAVTGVAFVGQSDPHGRSGEIIDPVPHPNHWCANVGPHMGKPGVGLVSTPDDGAIKHLVEDVLIGDSGVAGGETPCRGFADGFDHYIAAHQSLPVLHLGQAGLGSCPISGLVPGAEWYENVVFQGEAPYQRHMAAGRTFTMGGWCLHHGHSDQLDLSSETDVFEALNGKIDADRPWRGLIDQLAFDWMKATGQNWRPVCLLFSTTFSRRISSGHTDALLRLDAERADCIYVGDDYPLAQLFMPDDTHKLAVGNYLVGWRTARCAVDSVIGVTPRRVHWQGLPTYSGLEVTAKLISPQPMEVSTAKLPETAQYGLAMTDGNGTLNLSAIGIDSSTLILTGRFAGWYENELKFGVHRAIAASPSMTYAKAAIFGPVVSNGATGNLFDTTVDTVTVDGTVFDLSYEAPPVTLDVIPA